MPNSSDTIRYAPQELLSSFLKTTLFCSAIAITLWLLGLAEPLWASFAISFSIGYSINAASLLLQPLFIRLLSPQLAAIPTTLAGVGVGVALAGYLVLGEASYFFRDEDSSTPILALFFGTLGLSFFNTQTKLKDASAALAAAHAEQLEREKVHLETQLKLLQAQIEPHFLFNTLSNVVGMIRDQPDAAEQMLLNLTTLLRANLQRTRTETITLGDELAIIEALLKINQIRMGSRLSYQIHLADPLEATPLPPMLLQPLVENAIKHGIDPLEQGGAIRIEVSRAGQTQLKIEISDTGAGAESETVPGLNQGSSADSSGVGIANVQKRLAALFGSSASLRLRDNSPQGMIATLLLPLENHAS